MIRTRDGFWGPAGTRRRIAYRLWLPDRPKALLVLVHGLWEYVKRYESFAVSLAQRGLAVAGQDLRGHGGSTGKTGHFDRMGTLVDDLDGVTDAVFRPAAACQRVAVYGHSFGGLIAIHWMLRGCPVQRAVIQSPVLGVGVPVPAWKDLAARWIARWFPELPVPTGMDSRWISRDTEVVQDYRSDPKICVRLSAGGYQGLVLGMQEAQRLADRFGTPTLLLLGGGDRVISVEAARRWFAKIPARKQLMEFPGAYHELHHDSQIQGLSDAIDAWVMS